MPCNKREPGPAARRRRRRRPGTWRSWATRRSASPPTPRTWRWRWPRWTPGSRVAPGPARRSRRRAVDRSGLHRLPGGMPERDTMLRPGELITEVELPPPPARPAGRTARSASARRSRSRWCRSPPCSTSGRTDGCATAGSRSAAWRTPRGARTPRSGWCLACRPVAEIFARAADAELRYARPLPGNALQGHAGPQPHHLRPRGTHPAGGPLSEGTELAQCSRGTAVEGRGQGHRHRQVRLRVPGGGRGVRLPAPGPDRERPDRRA